VKLLPIIIVFIVLSSFNIDASYGCSCKSKPPKEAVRRLKKESRAIFIGNVKEVIQEGGLNLRVILEIERSWKSIQANQVTIHTSGGCMVAFEAGRKYLVYAIGQKQLQTNVCMRTRAIELAAEDIRLLGKSVNLPRN